MDDNDNLQTLLERAAEQDDLLASVAERLRTENETDDFFKHGKHGSHNSGG